MTARIRDVNGYITIKSNPVSRSGVFDYLGKSIGAPDPAKMYKVYRPAEELMDPDTQASFQLVPIVDDHTMLGPAADGHTPAEIKGIHGTTGTDIVFRDGVLYSDIKIFSETLADLIESGKSDLSLGYRCSYQYAPGTFAGQAYDFVQRSMRGNHLALVDEARCFVQVLDHKETFFGFDSVELSIPAKDSEMTPEEIKKMVGDAIASAFDARDKAAETKAAADAKAKEEADKKSKDDQEAEDAKKAKEAEDAKKAGGAGAAAGDAAQMAADAADLKKGFDSMRSELDTFKKDGMKSLMGEMAARDELYNAVSPHIGSFDCKDKTLSETAKYAAEKLGLDATDGQELAAVRGYLKAAKPPLESATTGLDARANAPKSDQIDNYIAGKK